MSLIFAVFALLRLDEWILDVTRSVLFVARNADPEGLAGSAAASFRQRDLCSFPRGTQRWPYKSPFESILPCDFNILSRVLFGFGVGVDVLFLLMEWILEVSRLELLILLRLLRLLVIGVD